MKAITIPAGAVVLVDTAPLIYWLEGHRFAARFEPLFRAIDDNEIEPVLTPVTLAELVTGPSAMATALAERYRNTFTSRPWRFRETDAEVAMLAARMRIAHRLKLPDAIQLATAILEGCTALVTHDRDFPSVPGLEVHGVAVDRSHGLIGEQAEGRGELSGLRPLEDGPEASAEAGAGATDTP